MVLMMWHDPGSTPEAPLVRMKVAKQRNGPKGDVAIRFDGPRYRFLDG